MTERAFPRDLSQHFSLFRQAAASRLHVAAHSHHFWPDVTRAAQLRCWDDAARLVDDKWGEVLGPVWGRVSTGIARHLNLPSPESLALAPNTHEFVNRLLSCCAPGRPVRILTSDGEFHSFRRQTQRLAEEGLVELVVVPAEPFESFTARFVAAGREAGRIDLVFVSQVLFNSGYALPDLPGLVEALVAPDRLIVIDGYHGFLARPTDLAPIADRAFYLAGCYKYAMGGEGIGFLHSPPGIAPRPRNTGWYAAFGALAGPQDEVAYAENGWRFMGATFDPSGLYRFDAVLAWMAELGIDAGTAQAHAQALQALFLAGLPALRHPVLIPANLVVAHAADRGNFLTFRHEQAAACHRALHEAGIVTDVRGDRLRVGFGLYHTEGDIAALLERLRG